MPSHYEQFRQSIGRDGPDYSIVESAVGRERDELEVELISNLDYFEALALGLLKSKAAIPHLQRMLADGSNEQRSASGRALWDIEGDPEYLRPTISVIHDRTTMSNFPSKQNNKDPGK